MSRALHLVVLTAALVLMAMTCGSSGEHGGAGRGPRPPCADDTCSVGPQAPRSNSR